MPEQLDLQPNSFLIEAQTRDTAELQNIADQISERDKAAGIIIDSNPSCDGLPIPDKFDLGLDNSLLIFNVGLITPYRERNLSRLADSGADGIIFRPPLDSVRSDRFAQRAQRLGLVTLADVAMPEEDLTREMIKRAAESGVMNYVCSPKKFDQLREIWELSQAVMGKEARLFLDRNSNLGLSVSTAQINTMAGYKWHRILPATLIIPQPTKVSISLG
jgi:hypothetical protein